jgi:sigma-B regulation protein RsbU (phosphoserine phosphatase)
MDASPLPGAQSLYDEAPCGLLLAAADGTVLEVNETLCRWLGYDRDALVGKRRFQDLLAMGGRIFWQTHIQPLLRIQSSVAEVKLELRRHDASGFPAMINIVEREHGGHTLLHVAVFVAEDRHKYERELLLQRQRAEELAKQHARDQQELNAARAEAEDRALFAEQLVGMVSHDIRNPLSVIHMSTVLLERGVPADQQKAVVARVSRAVARVQHLVADLLDFTQARLGSGLSMNKADIDLHQVVADSVGELAIAFPQCRLEHVRAGTGACQADPDRVTQAVGNLVANAANHGDAAQPITVRSEVAGKCVHVSVHNHGRTIPPELVPRLFEPMVRGEAGAPAKGVGLGLYIVRAIARGHGGEVRVQSAAGTGTTFTVEWPCS